MSDSPYPGSHPDPAGDGADLPLEPWLVEMAAGYNAPPPPPREEMWQRIQAARSVRPGRIPAPFRSGVSTMIAATLVAAVSVTAILAPRGGSVSAPVVAVSLQADTGVDPAVTPTPEAAAGGASLSGREGVPLLPGGGELREAGTTVAAGEARATSAPSPTAHVPVQRAQATQSHAPAVATTASGAPEASFRLAVAQHFAQSEVLLASFSADPSTEVMDPSFGPWVRDLLTTTRLLQDSPAGRDPVTGGLLDDLETVFVQLVQLPAVPDSRHAEERQIITRSLERTDLMTLLRVAAPAALAVASRAGE